MEIYSKDFFKIFEINFSYAIVETPLGRAVKMPACEAFIYSLVTGAGYLETPHYPYTPKGLMKLFYSAFDFKFVTGIFDNTSLHYTPYLLDQVKPYLFEADKYILPLEFTSDIELTAKLEELFTKAPDPQNYLIQRLECRKKGNGMEPFMEYLAAEYFKSEGYIVENQIPLAHATGSPDFGGYRLPRLPFDAGMHIIELALLRFDSMPVSKHISQPDSHLIVGEAKTSTSTMSDQLDKYLEYGVFNAGFEVTPLKQAPSSSRYGLVTIDSNYRLQVVRPRLQQPVEQLHRQNEYVDWLEHYIKFYLLANFSNDELNDYYQSATGRPIASQTSLVDFTKALTINQLIRKIQELK